jgi:hypothetical protein
MKITYAVTVCNEFIEIQQLIRFLLENKRIQDDIVVLYDAKNGDLEIESFLRANSSNGEFSWHKAEFQGHFADWKNKLTSFCDGDYIFQIDADELPTETLIQYLPDVIQANSQVETILVPRVNTVDGMDQDHMQQWGWNVNEHGWINWPDYQWRIWKNKPEIKWINKVHERLDGFLSYASIPADESLALRHPKTIDRQIKQNEYYNTL